MLKDKITPLIIGGSDGCPLEEDCPTDITCEVCLTNTILVNCRNEIKEVFKEYENTPLRKELIQKLLERFAVIYVEINTPKVR